MNSIDYRPELRTAIAAAHATEVAPMEYINAQNGTLKMDVPAVRGELSAKLLAAVPAEWALVPMETPAPARIKNPQFNLVNRRTGAIVGTYKTRRRAGTALDSKDNEYGAYVHFIHEVEA